MRAPRQAFSASASSERFWLGRRTGCRINSAPDDDRSWSRSCAPQSNPSYQQLQLSLPINHKKISEWRQRLAIEGGGPAPLARTACHKQRRCGNLTAPFAVNDVDEYGISGHRKMAAQRDLFLTDDEFRYAAECRRMARLARPRKQPAQRLDIAGYLRALESLGQIWAHPPSVRQHHGFVTRSVRR
jgi:hypothetical protein